MSNRKDTEVYKTILLAIPIIMGELAQMSLHLIDTAMVGAISYKHLAAASLVMTAANIPFVIGIGMTISVSQMVSMANGRRDHQLISHYLYNGFLLCMVFALLRAMRPQPNIPQRMNSIENNFLQDKGFENNGSLSMTQRSCLNTYHIHY